MTEKKEGILGASDLFPFVKDNQSVESVVDRLNEIIEKRTTAKKIYDALETTVEAGKFPIVTLELRMREMIRGIVQSMVLSEAEVKELVLKAIREATAAMDWSKEAQKIIESELKYGLQKSVQSALGSLFWDENVRKALRQRLILELQKEKD